MFHVGLFLTFMTIELNLSELSLVDSCARFSQKGNVDLIRLVPVKVTLETEVFVDQFIEE